MASRDYEEFIAVLNAHGARFLVIGAHAVAFHARPRATKDLDLLLDPQGDNPARALAAIRDFFGGAELGYSPADLAERDSVIQLGVAPVRIDIMCAIPGVANFAAAWENRVEGKFGSVPATFLSLEDLIRSKEMTGRLQDRADARALKRIAGRRKAP